LNADAAAAVGVVDKDNLTSVGERFFDGRELADFGAERHLNWGWCRFFVALFFSGIEGKREQASRDRSDAEERGYLLGQGDEKA
jgi:hypothetical protein